MASIRSRARECRATDDEGPDTWRYSRKSSICGLEDAVTEKCVHFVFLSAICVGGIGRDGSNTQGTLNIVDYIGRVVDITNTRSRGSTDVVNVGGGGSRVSIGL